MRASNALLPAWECTYEAPFGPLRLITRDGVRLAAVQRADRAPAPDAVAEPASLEIQVPSPAPAPILETARRWLDAYFKGGTDAFAGPLDLGSPSFRATVWAALADTPFGQTTTYGALARRVGAPSAARAVGRANGQNPLLIVVPCHRVIGADGQLVGYAGGLEVKRWLLAHEGSITGSLF